MLRAHWGNDQEAEQKEKKEDKGPLEELAMLELREREQKMKETGEEKDYSAMSSMWLQQ